MTQDYDVENIRGDFPILKCQVNSKPLVYLDNAASAQKPQVVIDTVSRTYSEEYANVHRGLHHLSTVATENYENVRSKIRNFINAANEDEIIYTSGSTESINIVAHSWAMPRLQVGDEIVLSVLEHHANIVPWHFLRERQGVSLKWVELDDDGALDPQRVADAISPATKLIALSHMSNVLGSKIDVGQIVKIAQVYDIPVLVDGSQSAVHGPVDVQALGVDFFALNGHKLYGPSGSDALYVRGDRLREMRPFKGGGNMIREVHRDDVTFADGPQMFEAGTPAIVEMIGFGAALDYLTDIGMERIAAHEARIAKYTSELLQKESWVNQQGTAPGKGAIFSFTLDCAAHPHDISTILDQQGIAVRAGHHCAQPLMDYLGTNATCRASFGLYNTQEEADKLLEGLSVCRDLFS